jgi:hypothetical protein
MPITQNNLTLNVLRSYYAEVHSLEGYIRRCIKEESFEKDSSQLDYLVQAPDSVEYRELLSSSLVCLSKETMATMESPQFQLSDHYDRMKDVSTHISDYTVRTTV